FFLRVPATSALYTLSLHTLFRSVVRRLGFQAVVTSGFPRSGVPLIASAGALRITARPLSRPPLGLQLREVTWKVLDLVEAEEHRSEEHTSELQSRENLVCRLLLE